MKLKKPKKIIISLLIISLLILSGCGGYSTLYHIQEIDYYSKINLKIPLHIPAASVGGEYLYMRTNDDMEDIKAELEAFSQEYNFSFINIRENALLLFYSKALFLLEKYVPDNPSQSKYKHYYRLLDFSSCLYPEDKKFEKVNGQMIRQIKGIPMPHYLFTEKSLGSQYPGLESIVVTEGIDGFQEFYELFNQYYDDYIPEVKKRIIN